MAASLPLELRKPVAIPAASAVKIGGERAYKLARQGTVVEMPLRRSQVYAFDFISYSDGCARLELHVGSGTYIRAIAEALGGHCRTLRRTAVGPFGIEEAAALLAGAERPVIMAGTGLYWARGEDQLRAERILVVPAFRDLLSAKVVLREIRIEVAFISMLRSKAGRMSVLPSLLEKPTDSKSAETTPPIPPISIGKVELINGTIEFYDATIRKPPLKLRLD